MRAKPTRQQRAADTRNEILAALEALLRRRPFSDISIGELAKKAGVAPGTIYQRFSNTEATASVLLELYYRRTEEWARRPPRDRRIRRSLREDLVAIAGNAYDQVGELGFIMRPAYLYSRLRPERVGTDWARLERVALEGFRIFVASHADEVCTRDHAQAASRLCALFNSMVAGLLLHPEAWRSGAARSRKEFAEFLGGLAASYLSTPPATAQ